MVAMPESEKVSVRLLQQGTRATPPESMPLASGRLKAMALADARIRRATSIEIIHYEGGATPAAMAHALVAAGPPPDILVCTVHDWSAAALGALAETFKRLNPDGWAVFGGPHVTGGAARTFAVFPAVDVVVHGEGEFTFRDLLNEYLDGASARVLGSVAGISHVDLDGRMVTTPPRERVHDMDALPSPALTGALDLVRADGTFRYDAALMETSRAGRLRRRAFSRERLRQELELYARLKAPAVRLCDAGFGLLPLAGEFVEDVIAVHERTGHPRALEAMWAGSDMKALHGIVRRLREAGLHYSFTRPGTALTAAGSRRPPALTGPRCRA